MNDRHKSIAPLVQVSVRVPNSELVFSAACFEGKDWSLAPLQTPEDVKKHPEFAQRLGIALYGIDALNVFAPYPAEFNGEIISRRDFNKILPILNLKGRSVFLLRNKEKPADGTFLVKRGDAGVFSAGGCGTIVTTLDDNMIFAHAGRECLLDRKRVETGGKERGRPHESVVDSIMSVFGPLKKHEKRNLRVWPFFFIKPEDFAHRFDDEKHGTYNRAAAEYIPRLYGKEVAKVDKVAVYPDLPKIAKAQFIAHDVPEGNIFLEHQYLSDELPTTRNGGGRYLTAIVRHS